MEKKQNNSHKVAGVAGAWEIPLQHGCQRRSSGESGNVGNEATRTVALAENTPAQ